MSISIIIPTFNETARIGYLVSYLLKYSDGGNIEIIVSDAGSTDDTIATARQAGAMAVNSITKGRAAQMNYGATLACNDFLYFVHADSLPPKTYIADIKKALDQGYNMGRYRTRFDCNKTILKINAWFTRFDFFICMGGDQTLFIKKSLFEKCNGFNEEMKIMEDYEFCERARQYGQYKILNGDALISARKYDSNSWLQVQLANSKIVRMYKNGASQSELVHHYQQMISYRKNAF